MSKDKNTIANIPATLALEASKQWKTIRDVQLIERLTQFRVEAEAEAETSIANIPTSLGLAMADVAAALDIENPDTLLQILGDEAYLQAYVDPIPYQLTAQEQSQREYTSAPKLLTKLQEIWAGKSQTGEVQIHIATTAKASPPITA